MKRRTFIKSAGVRAAASSLPQWFQEESLARAAVAKPGLANERLGVALVGCGGRGRGVAEAVAYYGDMIAVCDVDEAHIDLAKRIWPKAKGVKDFRKVMEMKEVDVVVCGTVEHWHTLVSLAAMRAGKDVYCEKPLTITIDEGKHIVKEEKRSGRIFQTGTQQRSDKRFRLACELVRNERIGKLKSIDVFLPKGRREGPFPTAAVPSGFDWDMWQGQTSDTPYVKERAHRTFRYWWEYSGGTMTDWGAHHNDIALWATGFERSGPVSARGKSLVEMIPGGFTAASDYDVEYTYGNGVTHRSRSTPVSAWNGMVIDEQGQHHGIRLEGTNGWIWVTRGEIEASDPDILTTPFGPSDERLYASDNHVANFIDSVRARKKAICDADIGHRSATMCHLGVTAIRLGRTVKWNPKREKYVVDKEAAAMVKRAMRKPRDYSMI